MPGEIVRTIAGTGLTHDFKDLGEMRAVFIFEASIGGGAEVSVGFGDGELFIIQTAASGRSYWLRPGGVFDRFRLRTVSGLSATLVFSPCSDFEVRGIT